MKPVNPRARLRLSMQYALTGGAVMVLLTLVCFRFGLGVGVAAPIYLLSVVLQSLTGDFLSAALISVLSAGCLDYFFTEPLFAFRMTRPLDVCALVAFLATALVITQLVSRLRVEIRFTNAQKERLDRLYQLSQQFLRLEPEAPEEELLEPLGSLFGVTAIAIFDAQTGEVRLAGSSCSSLAQRTREAGIERHDTYDDASCVTVRCLQLGNKSSGAIGFESLNDPVETAGPLAALTSAHFEKTRAFRTASAASAATQAEVYRSAILDALAHEFKTPLATILAAAGGIREAGPLGPERMEMAETVESEADRLGRLTTRLLRVARLDREEVRPRVEMLDVHAVIRDMVDQYSQRWSDRRISMVHRGGEKQEAADPELLRLAVSQLLDNACTYSPAGSTIRIVIEHNRDGLVVEVSNSGSSIPESEQRLIFERFYRGLDTKQHTAGSGLGLYVARKIALAHGGSLQLVTGDTVDRAVTFRMNLPASQNAVTRP